MESNPQCYWNKWHPSEPQCPATIVGRRPERLGNVTDEWTWCGQHEGAGDTASKGGPE